MRILIAEDEAIIRLDLRSQLESEGFEVCAEARDGEEAVELARKTKPDLAIMDVKMPRLDGIEAARQITAQQSIPIVILSAHSQKALVRRAVNAGISAYLVKPFDLRHLVPTIETALARHRELIAATTGPKPRTRRRRPADDRRKEIVAASARVFYTKGYEATTIQDIADAVGILKGSLYYYISSKEDLLFEVIRDVAQQGAATLRRDGDPVDAFTRLRTFLSDYAAFVAENIEAVTVSVRDERSLVDHRREAIAEVREVQVRALTGLVEEAQAEGAVTSTYPAGLLAETLLGMGDLIAHRHAPEGPSAEELANVFVGVMLGGFATEAAAETLA